MNTETKKKILAAWVAPRDDDISINNCGHEFTDKKRREMISRSGFPTSSASRQADASRKFGLGRREFNAITTERR